MISQIRIYTINKGEMDNFLKHFKEDIMVLHQKIGVPIVGTWVNRPQNDFIWVRTYKDKAELEAKNKEFPSLARGHRSQTWSQRCEDGSARGRIGVCVEADSTTVTGGTSPSDGKSKIDMSGFSLTGFKDLSQ
jgi:NIPSNAP